MQRPGIGRAAGYPALPADKLCAELEGHAGERRAGLAVIGAIHAVLLPDQRLHFGRRLALGHPEVIVADKPTMAERTAVSFGAVARVA